MKFAIMLRAMDQESGFRAYVEGLVDHMIRLAPEDAFLLLYRTPKWFGRFGASSNVREMLLRAPHKFAWDQVAVPYRAWRERADIIFNPKFSVPLISHCPVAMGLQEPDWYAYPAFYERIDLAYIKTMLPLYYRRAAHLFPMSKFNLEQTRQRLGLRLSNVTITYTCPGTHMKPVEEPVALSAFRSKYRLPLRFMLCVTRVDHPGLDNFAEKKFFPGKNPEACLKAFLLLRDRLKVEMVFAGRRVQDYFRSLGFQDEDFRGVHFIDFVPYEELPNLYSAAELSVVPTYFDGCSTTMMESMACGCPVIASNLDAGPEIGGDAALYIDPRDPVELASRMDVLVSDQVLRETHRTRSLERAAFFNWEQTAGATLEGLRRAATGGRTR